MSDQFTPEQKQYLEGFFSGLLARGGGAGAALPAAGAAADAREAPPAGPETIHRAAQDRFLSQGRKLCNEELAKRAKNPLDMWDEMTANAAAGRFPKGTDVFLHKFHGLFHVAPTQDAFMCRLRIPNGILSAHQRRASDFLYEEELEGYRRDGLLSRLDLAFSRDQAGKCYVQHRMRERQAELWAWLQEGAHLYVCGDATRMARDVDATLAHIVARQGGMALGVAKAYLASLVREGRYQRDVY
jgi:hypothetical protein